MKELRLEIDTNTKYMKILRGFGKIMMGLTIGSTLIELKHDIAVDWMNTIMLFSISTMFGFFPGLAAKRVALIINEEGIFTKGYAYHFQERSQLKWDKIRNIKVTESWLFSSGQIKITNSIGSSETISLPLHTKSQLQDLKTYLQEACTEKEITYSA